jgi:hypothetical protein
MVLLCPRRWLTEGFRWVISTLLDIDGASAFHNAVKLSDALIEMNRTGRDPWEIVGQTFAKVGKRDEAFDSPYMSI